MAKGKKTGGKKVGSRNKSTKEIKELIDVVAQKRHKTQGLSPVIDALFESAEGVTVQDTNEKGEVNVYTKEPNVLAIKTILEYRFGKPKEQNDETLTSEEISRLKELARNDADL